MAQYWNRLTIRRPWKHNGRWMPWWLSGTHVWSEGQGRFWKRQLSKARRRAWKYEVRTGKPLNITSIESEVNWKGW